MADHLNADHQVILSRVSGLGFAMSAALWGATALFVDSWWASPAFAHMGMTTHVAGVLWVTTAIVLTVMVARPIPAWLAVVALSTYAWATCSVAVSVAWATFAGGAVSAIGSAVAWAVLGLSAAARAATFIKAARR